MRWRKLIKDNQKNFSRLHMLIDVFVIAASYAPVSYTHLGYTGEGGKI